MAFHHIDVTLSGNTRVTATNTPVRQVLVHNTTGNAAVLVGDSDLSATSYGLSIAAGATQEVAGSFSGDAPVNLNEIYLRGTDAQVVHVLYVTH